MREQLRIAWVAILAAAALGLVGVSESAALSCGPGPHWIDACTSPDTDNLTTGAVLGLDLPGDGLWPLDLTQPDVNLVMFGPTTVDRAAASDTSTNFPGAFGSSLDSHSDVIDTELVALSLTGGGITVTAGAGLGNGGVLPPSKGVIVEDPSDNTLAQSFFDVFFEVDLGGGLFLYNQIPLTVQSEIDRVPPDAIYHHVITSPIPLYLGFANIGDPDFIFANLVTARHIVPGPSSAALFGAGLIGLLAHRWRARRNGRKRGVAMVRPAFRVALVGVVAATPLAIAFGAWATHVPVALDVPSLRPDVGAYLEFINLTEHPALIGLPLVTGTIGTEEHTGFTAIGGADSIEIGDGDLTHGDRADFDWVQEHRPDELAFVSNHPGTLGFLGWTIGVTEASPHADPGTGAPHLHSLAEGIVGGLPELMNPDFLGPFFNAVDVFSIISVGEDSDSGGAREMALDYDVQFANSITGAVSLGVPSIVWVPGWTAVTTIDDFVARWVPAVPGLYNVVGIDPLPGTMAFGHDDVVEIDAVKAMLLPEPSVLPLVGTGVVALGLFARRMTPGSA